MGKLEGKKAIITGGSGGIGKDIALAYAREGADVVITYNTQAEEAKSVVDEITKLGRKAIAIQADVSVQADREKILRPAFDI